MNNSISSEVTAELKRRRIINTITLTLPRIGILAAILAVIWWEKTIIPFDIAILVGMYILTIWGVSVGYHRLFSHKAFKTGPVMRALIGIAASISTQGPIISWVSHHRQHHIYSDQPGDVHSPHLHGEDLWGRIQGFWHSHFGWMIGASWTEPLPYTNDLKNDPVIQAVDRFHLLWILLSLALPAAIGGAVFGSWDGALRGLIWGGAIRIMLSFQGTISVNSICHLFGNRPFATTDLSRNNGLIAFLTLGEGWHNNHHAFPYSAQFGIHWWQYDFAWWTIVLMERLGLVWDVKRPSDKDLNGRDNEELAFAADA
ncbi:acyl-CoA desaturase [Roseofilum casamattae]|uniref:Acyl-CoA desaturase n=1 Tax=Roseofilum casamattae BLCC-M143 TaxID=3022442 RepID=A0ABT7C2F6_9CYAN|nr:acyl-CoA desaturase [Roseofilum casamattae]MDJ1185637.1 acyl-CoA desaturase [Roseofilum casamattae BLCC-M143]